MYRGICNGEEVAVKEYTSFLGVNNTEAQNFSKFNSPYIVRMYGACSSLNAVVLEYCRYGSVESCYGSPEMTDKMKSLICYDFARGIKYLHENNHTHRDLKPDNLLLVSFSTELDVPRAKLSDFGTSQTALQKTEFKSVEGTPAFIAPEVVTGKYDKRCDVYSFGMSVWSIFSEKMPNDDPAFGSIQDEDDFYQLIQNGVRPQLIQGCSFNDIISACWKNVFNIPSFTFVSS